MKLEPETVLTLLEQLPLAVFLLKENRLVAVNMAAELMSREWPEGGETGSGLLKAWSESAFRLDLVGGTYFIPEIDCSARRRSEQLKTFGTLTGGIVHNLNNPLNALSGMIQLMMFRNMDMPELEKLDHQTDVLATQIRHLGDRYRRLLEYETGAGLTWELVLREELDFYRADAALKHRCELQADLPADIGCPFTYRDASWLVDRMLEAVLLQVPHEGMAMLRVDLPEGWPRFRLSDPVLGAVEESTTLLFQPLMQDLLRPHGRRMVWSASPAELAVTCTDISV